MDRFVQFENVNFTVTDKGIEQFRVQFKADITDKHVHSKAKQRYLDYLHADSDLSFIQWLKASKPNKQHA